MSASIVTWTASNAPSNKNNAANLDIWYQDVSGSGSAVQLTTTTDFEQQSDVAGRMFVWMHNANINAPTDIAIYDMPNGALSPVASGTQTFSYRSPAINANVVVYERLTNGTQWDIDAWNYQASAPIGNPVGSAHITDDLAAQHNPRVSGDFIVFESYDDSGTVPQVVGCRITPNSSAADNNAWTCPVNPIGAATSREPDVDGSNVVFIMPDAPPLVSTQVYLYDGSTGNATSGTIRQLTNTSSGKSRPRIAGSHVVWVDDRNTPGTDIYSFDLTTNIEDKLAGGSTNCTQPAVDGNRVAYSMEDPTTKIPAIWVFTYTTPIKVPVEIVDCPANSTLEDGPYTVRYLGGGTVTSASHTFPAADPKKTYYFCVDSGRADGTFQASSGAVLVDALTWISPKDISAEKALAVQHYAKTVDITSGRAWAAALYSPQSPQGNAIIAVSLRSVPATATTSTASK